MDLSGFDKLLSESLGVSQRKQQELAETSQRMENKFNPLNWENVEHVDGDTFRLKDTGRTFRVQNDPSKSVDTFESDRRLYENDPIRLANHKRNYAKLTGRPEWSITINELVERGKVQSEQTRSRMAELGQQGRLAFQSNGIDDYGRELIQLYDTETGENFYGGHSGREQNASYDSKFNAGQQLEDIFTGERGRYDAFQGGRGVKGTAKDLGVSLAVGTGRMLTGLAQGTITLLGGSGNATDRFFNFVNEGLDNFHNSALSNEALARNARIDRNRQRNVEAYGARVQEYLREGYTEGEAKFFAGAEEFQDTVGDLITEPGYIIDKTVESLPYMAGVAVAGRTAVTQATKLLSKRVKNAVIKAGGTKDQARQSVARYMNSEGTQKLISRVATTTGVSTVGVTEALTNSSEVYNSVANMSEEEALKSDQYRSLRAEGLSHKEATQALAEAAFDSVFLPGMLMAAAASAITGAGGFEARLFTNRAGQSLVGKGIAGDVAEGAAKGGIIRRGATGTARNIGRFTRFAGPAGASEATEEAIQSGGGEFLSQLAQFEAGVGEEPGAGVGAAAGEGAAIGFVSGAGAQTLIGGAKKLADSDLRKSGVEALERAKNVRNLADNSGAIGGSKVRAQRNARNVSPEKAASTLEETAKEWEASDKQNIKSLEDLLQKKADIDLLIEKAEQSEQGVSPEVQKLHDDVQGLYVTALDRAAAAVLKRNKKPADRTKKEKRILAEAIANDVPSVREDEQNSRVYSHTRSAIDAIEKQTDATIKGTAEASAAGVDRVSEKVAREKMGRAESRFGPGLMGHFDRINEAIVNNDKTAIEKRFGKFNNFINSQRQKLLRLSNFLDMSEEDQAANKEFEYKEGLTENYHKLLQQELETMEQVHSDLSALYKEWHPEKKQTAKIPAAPKVPKRRNYGRGPDTQQSAEAETSNQPKTSTRPPAETKRRKRNYGSAKDENSTQQESAEDNVGQSSPDSGTGTATETEQEASPESEPVSEGTQGTETSAETQSEVSESSTTESTAPDVAEEVAAVDEDTEPAYAPLRRLDESLDGMNITQLKRVAKERGIAGYTKFKAPQVDELRQLVRDDVRNELFDIAERNQDQVNERTAAQDPSPVEQERVPVDVEGELELTQEEIDELAQSLNESGTAEESTPEENRRESIESAIYEENDFVAGLTRIWAFSDNELNATLAQRLLEVLEGRKIKITVLNDKDFVARVKKDGGKNYEDDPPTAMFLGKTQEVLLRKKTRNSDAMEEAFLHELTHAAINGWMLRPAKTKRDRMLRDHALKTRGMIINRLEQRVKDNPEDTDAADVLSRLKENKEEWIAYAWSNEKTQRILSEIDLGSKSAWTQILDMIKGILKLDRRSALTHTLRISNEIFKENEGQPGRTANDGRTHTPSKAQDQTARRVRTLLNRVDTLTTQLEAAEPGSGAEINLTRRLNEANAELEKLGAEEQPVASEAETAVEEAEAEVGAQAEAQPERRAETEAEATVAETTDNDLWWDRLSEVERLQSLLRNGSITEEQVRFPGSMRQDQERFESLIEAGNTATSALAQMETDINERLDRSQPRTEIPTEYLNLEEAVQSAVQLTKTGETDKVQAITEGASDFTSESNWERIKKWILGSYDRANIKDIITEAFRGRQIPTSIEAGFDTARDKARSLITAVPNLHDILNNPVGRRKLYDALELTPDEEAAFDAFAEFRNEMKDAVDSAFQELFRDKIDYRDGNRIAQNPAYLLTDETDTLLPGVITAIAYESMNWVTGDGSRLWNDDETIARILGLPDGAQPNDKQVRLRTAGTLRRNVNDRIGNAIYRHLNIRAKSSPDIAPNLDERMQAALGTIAIRALQITRPEGQRGPGRVQAITFDGSEFRAMKGEEATEHEDYSKPISFIRATAAGVRGSRRFLLSNPNGYLQEDIRPGRTAMNRVFGVSNVIKEPLTQPPTEENIPKKALRSVTRLSKKMREAIRFQQAREWQANTRLIDKVAQFIPEQYLKYAHEMEDDLNSVHDLELDNVEGRNRTLMTALENALNWRAREGDGSLWFTYSMTRTGRTMIDSTYINPQQSKIHRFLFGQKAWQETIQPGDTELLENFKIAVAQGMGIKVDKMTREAILAAVEARMQDGDVQEALRELATEGTINLEVNGEPTALGSLLKEEGTHTLAALTAWQDYLDADGGAFTTNLPIEVDGVTNGFAAGLLQTPPIDPQSMERLKDLLRAVGVIFTDDEEKSFAEWLRDPSNRDNYQTAAKKTAEAISRMMPGGDLFNRLDRREEQDRFMMVIGEEMNKMLASGFSLDEQALKDPKTGRDFAKNPLMIVAYGASSRTVANNLVENIWLEAHRQMAAVNRMRIKEGETEEQFTERQAQALLEILNKYMDVNNVGKEAYYFSRGWKYKADEKFTRDDLDVMIKRGLVKDKWGEPVTDIGGLARSFSFQDSKKEYLKTNFTRAMKAVYGRGIEAALAEMLDGIREIRNTYTQAITMMNAIFAIEFQRRVETEEAATGRVVGRQRRTQIVERMHAEGLVPSIASAYSDPNNLSENLELTAWQHNLINDQNVKILHDDYEGVTRIHYGDGTVETLGDTNSTTNNLTARDPSTDVGVAGIVGTIHSLDGTNSADIFGAFDVLNMFDAWVMKLSDLGAVPNQGNNRFYNQHRDYDMGQELVRSMDRMLILVTEGDGRLSPAQRRAAGNLLISEMKKHGQWSEDMDEQYTIDMGADGTRIYDTQAVMNDLAADMRSTATQVTEARAEIMQIIGRMDQFANDKTAYEVPENRRNEPLPTLEETEKHARQVASAQKISAKAATLARNLDGGNFNEAFFNWLQEETVRPSEALRVINELLQDQAIGNVAEQLNQLASILHNTADNTNPIVVGPIADPDAKGEFANHQITIDPAKFGEEDNPVETLLHEILHAATAEALDTLERENPELLNSIHARGLALYNTLKTRKPERLGRPQLEFLATWKAQKDPVIQTGEYLAYVQTGLIENDMNQLYLAFGAPRGQWVEAFRSVGAILTQGNTRTIKLRSSQDKVNNDLFGAANEGTKLEHQKLLDAFEEMRAIDEEHNVESAREYEAFLEPVMNNILLPGLAGTINDVILKTGVETDGTKNLGEVERGSDADILKVQTGGAKLTNPGDMSAQEVLAHELYHAITGFALESDTKVRAELRKIYEYAKERLTWEDFMPPVDEIAGDLSAVEAAAQERYDYVFGRVPFDKDGNPLVDQLQEFAALGMSNKPFALALSRIDAPSAAEPIWDGNILSSIINVIQRGLEILRGYTLGTRRAQTSAEALYRLSQQVVTINKNAKVRGAQKKGHNALWRNQVDNRAGEWITNKLDAAQRRLRLSEEEKKSNGSVKKWIRMGTHAALANRTEAQQKANREFMRHLGVNKQSALSEIISEVMPYNRDDRGGADGKMGFLDLLRHSKVLVDMARQRAIEHTSSVLKSAFDPKRRQSRAQRLAMTNVLLRTDLHALMQHNDARTLSEIQEMIRNDQLVDVELSRLHSQMVRELEAQGATDVLNMYERQMDSLANYMIKGTMLEDNGMKNVHNIVRQYNLTNFKDRVKIADPKKLDPILDQIVSLKALQLTEARDRALALEIIDHEMGRTDDNGFLYLMGMAGNFKYAALTDLFKNNPVQVRKGYVYDITDGDRNIEVIFDTPSEQQRMKDLGMVRIGRVQEDRHDRSAPYPRAMYKGFRGANTWQKSVVSLTSTQRQGTSLFEVSGFDPKRTGWNLGRMIAYKDVEAKKQFKPGKLKTDSPIAIPVLDEAGRIVDYTYEMSLKDRAHHLKNTRNNDYYDLVIPRQFGSIPDRTNTKKINSETADLIFREYMAFKDSPEHRFAKIGKYSNKRGKDMWNVIPDDMKRELAEKFKGTEFVDKKGRLIALPLRDEAVNLVMGFRKLSILDLPGPKGKKLIRGQKATFAAKTAEKVWQEIMQLVRIKMAIINPEVVIGNLSSNFGILAAKGIPAEYIQRKTTEAIRGMRQYQRDVRRVDELQREIGVRINTLRGPGSALNDRKLQRMVNERESLKAELRVNPVGKLVNAGLFTSIVEEVSSDEDTYREWIVGSALDKFTSTLPAKGVQLAKEAYMLPGSNAFNMAIAATQYGDFIGRYVQFRYETEQKGVPEHDAINNALATFIYYDMPQNRWLQYMNDNGFMMFTKFFLRIQPVIAQLFQENPVKATGVFAVQQALMNPFDENIGKYALFNGLDNRYEPFPLAHVDKLDPFNPSLFQWFNPLGL